MEINNLLNEGLKRGIISADQAAQLCSINDELPQIGAERKRGLNTVMALYYFGALIIIFAFTYFLVSQWNSLPTLAILMVSFTFQMVCLLMGVYLRRKLNYGVSGGLLVSAAIAMTPLIVYAALKMLGFWPVSDPRSFGYHAYWTDIKSCWIYIELITLVVAIGVLYWVRFSFIALIIGHTAWFLSMDLADAFLGGNSYGMAYWESRKWFSIIIGAAMIGVAKMLNRKTTEDYSMWLFIYGGIIFSTASAFAWLENQASALMYLTVHVGFVVASVFWQRKSLLVFGAIGIYVYLSYLAFRIFAHSPFFPIALALIGLLMILGTVSFQRNKEKILKLIK